MYFSTNSSENSSNSRVHQETVRLALAHGAAVEQIGVATSAASGRRDANRFRCPSHPATASASRAATGVALAIISLSMPCMSRAMARTYSKAISPRKIAGWRVSGEKRQRRVGGGEVVAAEIEFVGDVAFARVDVLAVQVAARPAGRRAARAIAAFHLVLKSVTSPGNARHRVHAPNGAVAPGRVEEPRGELSGLVVVAAGQQRLGVVVSPARPAAWPPPAPPPCVRGMSLGIRIHQVIGSV